MLRIAVSCGDPAGIGYEVAVKASSRPEWRGRAEFAFYGAPSVAAEAIRRYAPGFAPEIVDCGEGLAWGDFPCGEASARCGRTAVKSIDRATRDVIEGRCAAIVTAPVNKYAINLAGVYGFSGHTERIAELCGCRDFAMMQSSGALRVAFVTTHIPLGEVPKYATFERICTVARLLARAVRSEGIARPKIACAAINPHAGENGCMGREDEDVTKPALEALRREGMEIEGPFPPDTLFIESARRRFDGILSMYHDQGHIPFKMLAFNSGVNSTIGLPIIRTSPDHGTAFDIAWRGCADCGSMSAAIALALKRAENREK